MRLVERSAIEEIDAVLAITEGVKGADIWPACIEFLLDNGDKLIYWRSTDEHGDSWEIEKPVCPECGDLLSAGYCESCDGEGE